MINLFQQGLRFQRLDPGLMQKDQYVFHEQHNNIHFCKIVLRVTTFNQHSWNE